MSIAIPMNPRNYEKGSFYSHPSPEFYLTSPSLHQEEFWAQDVAAALSAVPAQAGGHQP